MHGIQEEATVSHSSLIQNTASDPDLQHTTYANVTWTQGGDVNYQTRSHRRVVRDKISASAADLQLVSPSHHETLPNLSNRICLPHLHNFIRLTTPTSCGR